MTVLADATVLAAIPSPTQGVWEIGPFPLRAYALCIIAGIVLACWLGERRWVARGGAPGDVLDIAVWAVPFGIVGGRIYHVITTPQPYFGADGDPLRAFAIWEGGLGIWGAIALGGVGAWIGCRRRGIPLPAWADAIAPGIVLAQAVGRLGNWFNNELYGSATDLPWALTIYRWNASAGQALTGSDGEPVVLGTFHPTFLYELLWNLGVAALVIWADRRFQLSHGRAFALYVAAYCAGRVWIEMLRIDTAEQFLGLRLNVFTSVVVGLLAVAYLIVNRGRPREVITRGAEKAGEDAPAEASSPTADGTAPGATTPGVTTPGVTTPGATAARRTATGGTVAGETVTDRVDEDRAGARTDEGGPPGKG
ncbi:MULTISPECIES: prolipoprotein diacylglyceryl transferase [unclassified Modestobacter]|uniref:prolipoprotein diacylglyceryl transferase n=1 Tax=unclassified Modestobacter TaxID=2643866 RepID=UPI0022AAC3B6|nr:MULTISPECIES: prolipoprotein diacylglyceryl transferase [unclassified Modestobacter]MCZ2824875.1 prolipoprotein diacylglyceryl transferase [Modestobacter sp. VKM Ac-2981]MCZ2854622.1 prolipoprotein diacylglyceryl transferase [Modestobacter sp. VKM Ac-2982]